MAERTENTLPGDLLRNFDVELQQFYYDAICKEANLHSLWNVNTIRRSLKEVVDAYKKETVNSGDSFILFDSKSKRCAYVMKHSPCFTSAVANYLLKLLNQNPDVLEVALDKGRLDICCLGGGPASDAVAVVRIVRALYHPRWLRTRKKLDLRIYVVDLSDDWLVTAKNVLEGLQQTPEFFGEDEISLVYSFLAADLTQPMSSELKEVIKSADVITMVYFLSAVNGSKSKDRSNNMMETIMLTMKKGAFLFFLDSAAEHHYKILNAAAEKRNTMEEIYGPLVEEFHTLSIASVKKFLELYTDHFNRFFCMTSIFLCVSSWRKRKIISNRKLITKTLNTAPPTWIKPTQEESDRLTRMMLAHRTSVRRLVKAPGSISEKHRGSKSGRDVKDRDFKREDCIEVSEVAKSNVGDLYSCRAVVSKLNSDDNEVRDNLDYSDCVSKYKNGGIHIIPPTPA